MPALTSGLASSVDHQRVWDLGYELLELSTSQTYCDVWRIRHRSTYELFAWKQLRPEWEADPRARSLLENEAAVGQLVPHPLFLKLIDAQLDQPPRFVIWEWFEAKTLEQLLREYVRLPISTALWIARQSAEGLAALQQVGLTHGDLRAAHVLVDSGSGLVKLTELGSSRRVAHATGLQGGRRVNQPGPLADYESVVSPPHLQGGARDLYSLGVILYQSLTGRMPYTAETPADLVRGRNTSVSDDLRKFRPDVSSTLADLVARLVTPQTRRQLQHPAELVNRLMELEVAELAMLGLK